MAEKRVRQRGPRSRRIETAPTQAGALEAPEPALAQSQERVPAGGSRQVRQRRAQSPAAPRRGRMDNCAWLVPRREGAAWWVVRLRWRRRPQQQGPRRVASQQQVVASDAPAHLHRWGLLSPGVPTGQTRGAAHVPEVPMPHQPRRDGRRRERAAARERVPPGRPIRCLRKRCRRGRRVRVPTGVRQGCLSWGRGWTQRPRRYAGW